jgi:hemolysin activation/secretion protein
MSLTIMAGLGRRPASYQMKHSTCALRAVRQLLWGSVLAVFATASANAQAPTAPALAAPAEQAAENHFDVFEYRVLGNTVLPKEAIERAVYPHLGEQRTLTDVESARGSLEKAYRDAGFGTVFVDIPEQDVDRGVVRLKVTEGKLNRVRVENARYFSARRIREALPAAQRDTVPSLPELQSQIATFNAETPDRAIVPVLAAGSVPGTVDLTLKVDDNLPFHGSLEVNDQYTADTSRLRVLGSLSYSNLFNRLDNLSLQYQTAPEEPSEFGVFAANFSTHVGESGKQLAFYYVHSDSDVASLGTLSVLGKGQVFGSRWIVPLTNTAEASHTISVGADYKDFLESIQLDPEESFQTPISYVNLSIGNTSVWRGPRQQWTLSSSANLGPRGLMNSSQEFADKRYKARPNYFYLRADASSRTILPKQFSLLVRLSGQYAVEPVIGNEQFAIGGSDGPRGYLEAAQLGDYGVKGTLQLGSPPWQLASGAFRLEGFAFFDAGIVAIVEPLPNEDSKPDYATDLQSWGLGVNIAAFEHALASLSWAQVLVDSGRTAANDSRLLFTVRWAW